MNKIMVYRLDKDCGHKAKAIKLLFPENPGLEE